MNSDWRPTTGWQNPYEHSDSVLAWDVAEAYANVSDEKYDAYEAGASAIIPAILKEVGEQLRDGLVHAQYFNRLATLENCIEVLLQGKMP